MASKPSTAIAVRNIELVPGKGGAIIPVDDLRAALKGEAKLRIDLDDADIAAAMLERKLSATDVSGLASSGELDEIKAVCGQPVCVMGAGFRNSDDQYADEGGSLGIYVVLNIVTTSGETLTVGTGGGDVVVTVNKILELDLLGTWWIIAPSAKETKRGFRPLNMTPAKVNDGGVPF
jgi:hypothetical protein